MDDYNNLEPRGDLGGRSKEAESPPRPTRRLGIPVKSWDAYRDWCERVRDSWRDDDDDDGDNNPVTQLRC